MSVRVYLDGKVTVHAGDCLDVLDSMAENSVDSVVCDPPYHLTSIVKRFGGDMPPRTEAAVGKHAYGRHAAGFMGRVWDGGDIAFRPETWAKVLRVLKPGGYVLAFASTRGFGRMSVAIEDAGFHTHPFIAWIFATGFPKATRIKAEGYDGFRYGGQALKPAIEPIYMGQKPFEDGLTGTANILKHGTGALNIDGCRVPSGADHAEKCASVVGLSSNRTGDCYGEWSGTRTDSYSASGRWPANICHDGSDEVLSSFPETGAGFWSGETVGFVSEVRKTDRPSRVGKDSGSAARYFYSAKADADDRLGSKHPTVKPVDLMQWLVRLVTPPGGICLDPFAGTGTTGEAAFREGFKAILIEREEEYLADIERRMGLVLAGPDERRRAVLKQRGKVDAAGPLFAEAAE